MVEVRVDPDRVVLLEQRAHLAIDALRQEHWNAGSESDDLDVRNGAESGQDFFEVSERQRKWIAARDDDIANLGMIGNVLDHLFDLALSGRAVFVDPLPLPRAVAAVERAVRGDEEKAAVGIAMNDPGDGRVAFLIERIPGQFAGIEQLLGRRP